MDIISICAMMYVCWLSNDPCQDPYKWWYITNSVLAGVSLIYLTWWVNAQLVDRVKTFKAEVFAYFIEALYVLCTCFAWSLFKIPVDEVCYENE